MVLDGTGGYMRCPLTEKKFEHASCLPGLAQVFFSQSAVGLTQAPQLLSHWVPPLSHAFLPAAVINIDLNVLLWQRKEL